MIKRTEKEIMKKWEGEIDKPLVSICSITYNHENFIEQALEGFLRQETTFPFEILIHDDASTDKTASIIHYYEKEYPSIIKPIYQSENQYSKNIGGINEKFNFPRAKGKYIALCEGDDYWTDSLKLYEQVKLLEENKDFSGVHHKVLYIDKNGNNLGESNRVDNGYEIIDYKYITQRNTIRTCSYMFRKNIINKSLNNMVNKAPAGDRVIFIMSGLVGKIAYIDKIMGAYRKNVGIMQEWSRVKGFKNFIDIYDIFEENEEFPEIKDITKIAKRYYYYKLSIAYSEQHEYYRAFQTFILLLYYTFFIFTTKEEVVFKVSFKQYIKTGIFTIPYMRELLKFLHLIK